MHEVGDGAGNWDEDGTSSATTYETLRRTDERNEGGIEDEVSVADIK